jgi:hypothetical protein
MSTGWSGSQVAVGPSSASSTNAGESGRGARDLRVVDGRSGGGDGPLVGVDGSEDGGDGVGASTLAKTSHLLLAKTGHPPAARPGATPPQGGHGDDQEAVLCLSALVRA